MTPDQRFMALALEQGDAGRGTTSPNPSVGAVVVSRGRVIGRGRTQPPGGPHAEIMALRQAGAKARGATLYCTLEPCNHTGRTGPCTEAIIAAGITRVVYGTQDANPNVKGGGAIRLRRARIEVLGGVLRAECDRLHAAFFKHVTLGLPWVTLKVASTLDGRLAASSGDSRWITGPEARLQVHRLRAKVDAVMVGAGTVRADDPQLTARDVGALRQPLRIVIEGAKPLPLDLKVFDTGEAKTLLVTPSITAARHGRLERLGVEVLVCERGRRREVDLGKLLPELGRRGLLHVLCEGGAGLATALVAGRHVDRIDLYLAPRLLGQGQSWLDLPPTRSMAEALDLTSLEVEMVGSDLHVTAAPSAKRA